MLTLISNETWIRVQNIWGSVIASYQWVNFFFSGYSLQALTRYVNFIICSLTNMALLTWRLCVLAYSDKVTNYERNIKNDREIGVTGVQWQIKN
jgi:hypothetical protein